METGEHAVGDVLSCSDNHQGRHQLPGAALKESSSKIRKRSRVKAVLRDDLGTRLEPGRLWRRLLKLGIPQHGGMHVESPAQGSG